MTLCQEGGAHEEFWTGMGLDFRYAKTGVKALQVLVLPVTFLQQGMARYALQDSTPSTPSTSRLPLARNFVVCGFVLSGREMPEMPSYAKDLLQWQLGQECRGVQVLTLNR